MDRRDVIMNSQSNVFQILLWFIFVVVIFSVGARLGTKLAMTRKLGWDDQVMIAATIAYLAQCISISQGASQGLGKPQNTLSTEQLQSFLKAEYASIVFLLLTLALIKWSISAFIHQLSPSSTHIRLNQTLSIIVAAWFVSSVLVSLFQCEIPVPWDYIHGQRCIDRRVWWIYVVVVNIVTEFFIVTLYFIMLATLKISRMKKAIVLLIFSTRLLIIVAAVAQLFVFLNSFPSSDLTEALWIPILLNQVVLSLSVVTACAPYLKPFMESLESGIVRVENLPDSEEELSRDRTGTSRYYLTDLSNSSAGCSSRATDRC
ncbi:hypothetical protein F5Y18DRAFT_430223 [Xylariaceae sp. FL1019]|nr:hypothetical protein F5Y18DRAFT_430223 [Xylariaceae sp. FL1019]